MAKGSAAETTIPAVVRDALVASGDWEGLIARDVFTHLARSTQAALQVIGAWADLDWDDMERSLDRIRHDSIPTPPIEL